MKTLLLVLLILHAFLLHAQVDSSRRTTIIHFENSERTGSHSTAYGELIPNKADYRGMAVKLGLTGMFSGMYGLYFEKEFGESVALEAGGGLTGKNHLQAFVYADEYAEQSGLFTANDIDEPDNYYDFESRKPSPGYFISLQPKVYYSEGGFDGGYLGLMFLLKRYNFNAYDVTANNSIIEYTTTRYLQEFESHKVIALTWGYQNTGDHVVVDIGIGLGTNFLTGERRDTGFRDMGPGNLVPMAVLTDVKQQRFYAAFNLKLGFWWSKKVAGEKNKR